MIKKAAWVLCLLFIIPVISRAEAFNIKPFFGYSTVRMNDVNDDINFRVNELRKIVQTNIPAPDPFKGNYAWGVQIEYPLQEKYFVTLTTFYFSEKTSAETLPGAPATTYDYHYSRKIELFDVSIGLNYYFNYSSWKRLNTYFGAGAGLGSGWSSSDFQYDDTSNNHINNTGDFSSNALTAYFCLGGTARLFRYLFLSAEAGVRFANLRQMDGKLKVDQTFSGSSGSSQKYTNNDFTTEALYDYTGFYFLVGTGIVIPFFK